MADLEFPKNTSSSTKETAESINKTSKANTDKIVKAIQIATMANAQATADKWYKKDRAKGIAKADVEQKLDKIGGGIKNAISPITKGLKEIGEKVVDSTKSAVSDTYTEVFGSGILAESIKSTIGTSLKKINDTLTNIGSWLWKKGGTLLKNTLISSLLFFKWLKNFLKKSLIFKAFSSLFQLIGGGIKGLFNFGGDLLKSIATRLVSSAAVSALTSGIKKLIAGLTASAFMPILAGALAFTIGGYLGKNISEWIYGKYDKNSAYKDAAEIVQAGKITGDVDRARVLRYYEDNVNNLNDEDKELFKRAIDIIKKDYNVEASIRLSKVQLMDSLLASRGVNVSNISAQNRYEELIKAFPTEAKSAKLESRFGRYDKDNSGYDDFNNERFNNLMSEILKQNSSEIGELKRKSTLKNSAGVSST